MLGPRLRERRNELGKTLADVASAATLSTGYLSSIEKGTSVPSLPVLARIAHALEISLAEILRTSASARLARGHLTDAPGKNRLSGRGSQLHIVRHCAKPGDTGLAPVELGANDVFVFLFQGRLNIVVDNEVFELGRGDALHCDRPKTLSWRVPGSERALALWATPTTPRKR